MSRKTGSILLIAGGGIMAIFYGIITALEIMKMVENEDFVTNFAETLIPLLVFVGGTAEIVVGISNRKRIGALAIGEIAPLIAAIVFSLIGVVLIGLNNPVRVALVTALIGAVAPVAYLIAVKKR